MLSIRRIAPAVLLTVAAAATAAAASPSATDRSRDTAIAYTCPDAPGAVFDRHGSAYIEGDPDAGLTPVEDALANPAPSAAPALSASGGGTSVILTVLPWDPAWYPACEPVAWPLAAAAPSDVIVTREPRSGDGPAGDGAWASVTGTAADGGRAEAGVAQEAGHPGMYGVWTADPATGTQVETGYAPTEAAALAEAVRLVRVLASR